MAFVYEEIAEADIDRFNLYKTENRYGLSKLPLHWSFDRETDTWLRRIGSDREVPNRERFEFRYSGVTEQLVLDKKVERQSQHLVFTWSGDPWLSSTRDASYLGALRAALTAYEDGRRHGATGDLGIEFGF